MARVDVMSEDTASRLALPGWLQALAIVAVACVAMQPYYFGYRLSGDDIWFLTLAIEGWQSVRDNALHVAMDQGRIGQVLMVPLNVLGALLAGDPLWRVAILAAYALQMLLFAVFVARLLRHDVRPFLFLLLLTLHPLAFAFMPPNAYPLQNTVPFIVMLVARLVVLHLRRRSDAVPFGTLAAQAAFVLGMFVSEFAVAFGLALLAAEYLARLQWAREDGPRTLGEVIRTACPWRLVSVDAMAVLCVLAPYVLFRAAFPGNYDGNSAGGLAEPVRVLITILGHIRDGTAFSRLGGGLSSASAMEIVTALAFGAATAVLLRATAGPVLRIAAPIATIAAALALAVLVTLPVAVSVKYQEACVDRGACAYIDSRISYLMVTVALMAAVAAACRIAAARWPRGRMLAAASVTLGIVAALVSVYNAGKARDMRQVHAVWQRADAVACAASSSSMNEVALIEAIDPRRLIAVNPPNRAVDFWRIYLPWRAERHCES